VATVERPFSFRWAKARYCAVYVGNRLSASLTGSGLSFGDYVNARDAYSCDKANGATLLSVPVVHRVGAL